MKLPQVVTVLSFWTCLSDQAEERRYELFVSLENSAGEQGVTIKTFNLRRASSHIEVWQE